MNRDRTATLIAGMLYLLGMVAGVLSTAPSVDDYQGLSVAVDSAGIGRIAALLGVEVERRRAKRLATIQQHLAKLDFRWNPPTARSVEFTMPARWSR